MTYPLVSWCSVFALSDNPTRTEMVTEGYSSLPLESGRATPFVTFGDSELWLLARCRMIPGEYGSGLPPTAANHFEKFHPNTSDCQWISTRAKVIPFPFLLKTDRIRDSRTLDSVYRLGWSRNGMDRGLTGLHEGPHMFTAAVLFRSGCCIAILSHTRLDWYPSHAME